MLEHLAPSILNANSASPAGKARATLSHPDEVLWHPELTSVEKREILAAWASDANAVPDAPGLRQLDSGAVVSVDAVLEALRTLDAGDRDRCPKLERRFEAAFRRFRGSIRKVKVKAALWPKTHEYARQF